MTTNLQHGQPAPLPAKLLRLLFAHGLNELIVMHISASHVVLGELLVAKGRLVIKDSGLMKGIQPHQVAPCTEAGMLGGLCYLPGCEWKCLSFLGSQRCVLPVDLSATRNGLLAATRNEYGQALCDFNGSTYRAFHVMLDRHFLPIPLLRSIRTRLGPPALAVCDLRIASIPLSIISAVNELVRASLAKKYQNLDVADLDLGDEQFGELFKAYLQA